MNAYNEIKGTLSCLSNLSSVTLGELKYLSLKRQTEKWAFALALTPAIAIGKTC